MNLGSCTIGAETLDSLLPASKDNVTTQPPHTSASIPSIVMDCKSPNKNDAKIVFSVYKHGVFLHVFGTSSVPFINILIFCIQIFLPPSLIIMR